VGGSTSKVKEYMKPTETALYEQIAKYLNLKHRGVLYRFDQGGMWTSSHKARNLYGRLNSRAWPDLFLAKPVTDTPCAGLFLELKREGTRIQTKAGRWANPHIEEQAAVLDQLRDAGYYCEFAVGFTQAVAYIDAYLGSTEPEDDGVPF
jgi:hypothetical protein